MMYAVWCMQGSLGPWRCGLCCSGTPGCRCCGLCARAPAPGAHAASPAAANSPAATAAAALPCRRLACRMLDRPESLLELSGHSHWVWNAAFSPFHDSLLASSSTDTTVCAWYTPALAKRKGPAADPQQLASRPQQGGVSSRCACAAGAVCCRSAQQED